MLRPRLLRSVFSLCLALPACGDDTDIDEVTTSTTTSSSTAATTDASASSADASSSSTGHDGPCTYLTPTETTFLYPSLGVAGLDMRVDRPLDGYEKTRLTFELYQADDVSPIPTGTFDLTMPPDDDYATCERCFLLVAFDVLAQPRRAFFQSAGHLTLDHFDADTRTMAGSIDDLRLVEVVQSPEDLSWSVAEGGLCYEVAPIAFDTRPVDGGACEKAEDCPNIEQQSCDVETKTCISAECRVGGDGPFCPEDQRCLAQYGALLRRDDGGPITGGCYDQCLPGLSECDGGAQCLPLGPVQEVGVCLPVGDAALGAACNLPDVTTGCVAGAMCDEPGVCREICTFLQPDSGCDVGSYCTPQNLCRPLSYGDSTPIGQACDDDSPFLGDCGPEGNAFRGVCVDYLESGTSVCERWCSVDDPVCPAGGECVPIFDYPLVGVCHVPGECGDGAIDFLGGELCDDGNLVDGDGCNADCITFELAPLCAAADTLPLDTLVTGTIEDGVVGFTTQCSPYPVAYGVPYLFTPVVPGKLSLRLDSTAALALGVSSECTDPSTELGCSRDLFATGSQRLEVNLASPGEPALVLVRAATPGTTGGYFLLADFAPAVCGDDEVTGDELCDDGNTSGGDGCSADCSVVDWMAVCEALPALSLAAPNEGTIDVSGTEYFALQPQCSVDGTDEDAYAFTAPSNGTLTLGIEATADLVVYVGDGCAAIDPAGFLSCINWFAAPGEVRTTQVSLNAGQRVTVVVEGYRGTETGAYTLTASFAP